MQFKEYLMEAFNYNDVTNKKLLGKMKLLDNTAESVKLFSHLINTQRKWMAAIMKDPLFAEMSWWEPVYDYEKLEEEWDKSTGFWIGYLSGKTNEELATETAVVDFENTLWGATLQDIALQLIYHSIHHRAQIQMLIRQQGLEPDFIDYIGIKVRKLG